MSALLKLDILLAQKYYIVALKFSLSLNQVKIWFVTVLEAKELYVPQFLHFIDVKNVIVNDSLMSICVKHCLVLELFHFCLGLFM